MVAQINGETRRPANEPCRQSSAKMLRLRCCSRRTRSLLVATFTTMILIMHTRSGYLVINFKDDQKVIQQSMGASSPSTTAMHNHGNSPDENESTSIELSSNNFTFPSPETRVKYYMGDWYGRTVSNSDDVLCNEISAFNEVLSDQTVLWRERKMAEEIAANSSKKLAH